MTEVTPVQFKVVAHVQDFGDNQFDSTIWVGLGDNKAVEGFAIFPPDGMDASELRYRAVEGDGSLSDWCAGGEFCGSRGLHQPIRGLCIELLGRAAEEFDFYYGGSFADGAVVEPVRSPDICRSPGLARLLAFRLTAVSRAGSVTARGGVRVATPEQPPHPPPQHSSRKARLPRPPSRRLSANVGDEAEARTMAGETAGALVELPGAATFIRFVFKAATEATCEIQASWAQASDGRMPHRADGDAESALLTPVRFNGAGADFAPEETPAGETLVATIPGHARAYFSDWMPMTEVPARDEGGGPPKAVLVRTQLMPRNGPANDGDDPAATGSMANAGPRFLALQVQSLEAGYTVLYAGASRLAAAAGPADGLGVSRAACRAMTAAGTPFAMLRADAGQDAGAGAIAASAIAAIEALAPDFVMVEVSNRNDLPYTFATQDGTWHDAMQVVNTAFRHGATPILVTVPPSRQAAAPDAPADNVRHLNNDRARASDMLVFDWDALLADGAHGGGIPAASSGSLVDAHQGDAARALAGASLASLFAGIVTAARQPDFPDGPQAAEHGCDAGAHRATQVRATGWSASQYRKFEDGRTRPVRDLLARVAVPSVAMACDIGCGPGNSTELLRERFPHAAISGLDSSSDMIEAARRRLPDVRFEIGDINAWTRTEGTFDLILANAVLQWVPDHAALLPALLRKLNPGGALAVQMPDNLLEPAHRLMREIASDGAWAERLSAAPRDLDASRNPAWYYGALRGAGAEVDVWRTVYHHALQGAAAVVEWFKGSALRPFLAPLDAAEQAAFLRRYEAAVAGAYPAQPDGIVLLPFPRLFFVATKPGGS